MSIDKQTHNRRIRKPSSDFQRLSRRFMSGLLRSLFFVNNSKRLNRAGFVLPTTVLLLLVVSLTVGALSFRTFSRTSQTIAYRDQQVVDSLAAPAIDRAKAKIEFLFTQDASVADKRPPSSTDLLTALAPHASDTDDPYTITGLLADGGETRVDIDSDGAKDTAWTFQAPDGTKIVYTIMLDDTNNGVSIDSPVDDQAKATNFVVRNGPIDTTTPTGSCPVARLAGNGWQLSGARLAKNIQVNVLAIKGSGPSKTVSAAEYQQVRTAARGNRWGAWFRYDMEISPGSPLRWNGAMHTEGSLVANKGFVAYMVSSPNSCIYSEDTSVIEVSGEVDNDGDGTAEFQGQLVSGSPGQVGSGSFKDDAAIFHTNATAQDSPNFADGVAKLSAANNKFPRDSVTPKNGGAVADILQDAIRIFTEDEFIHTDFANAQDRWDRYPNWETTGGVARVINDDTGAVRPFLDDGYRADNRYGPKPIYNDRNSLSKANGVDLPTAHKTGENINDNPLLVNDIPNTEDYGLDGYWERSAAAKGLRFVVGQRLELGNAFGWGANADPLYPANGDFEVMQTDDATPVTLKKTAETLQMRSLRDNLAAVQSMAVYHYADSATSGRYPLACLASTVHPGTVDTLKNSRTFERYDVPDGAPSGTAGKLKVDFLTGNGTNGVEFSPPAESDFVDVSTGVMAAKWSNPLKNLAFFAGDPAGGAPSFPAAQGKEGATDGVVHPYPYTSMWGDFSVLRRIFAEYNPTNNYNSLSIADKSTLHTAACTLGMLAYNIDASDAAVTAALASSSVNWTNMGVKLSGLVNMNNISNGSPIIGRPVLGDSNYKAPGLCKGTQSTAPNYSDEDWTGCPSQNPNDVTLLSDPEHPQNYFARFSTADWLEVLQSLGTLNATQADAINILIENTQILRDRTLGFNQGSFTGDLSGNFNPDTGVWTNPSSGSDEVNAGQIDPGDTFRMGCDPRLFASGQLASGSSRARLGLALVMCAVDNKPKYPSLYYVFPRFAHDQLGADDSATTGIDVDHTQPNTEDYINQQYLSNATTGVNRAVTYQPVTVADIALTPHVPTDASWKMPTSQVATGTNNNFVGTGPRSANSTAYNDSANNNPVNVDKNLSQNVIAIKDSSGSSYKYYQTAALEKAMMDGRELLSVRLMDLDIGLLTNTSGGNTVGGESWIPDDSGVVYAFREDAVREDTIVRPYDSAHFDATDAWNACRTMPVLTTTANCYMSLDPSSPHDPPLNVSTGISPKPVDMFADPGRRPYGFRLVNGESLNRVATSASDPVAGMTFVTDNTVYIRGDFNLHAVKGAGNLEANLIEEFKGTGNLLGTAFATYTDSAADETSARQLFYGRDNLDERFADPSQDNWRPVEIFSDGITILSNVFLDGSVEDYFVTASPDTTDGNRGNATKNSSYLNANRPWFRSSNASKYGSDRWLHEDSESDASPVLIDRNGKTFRKIDAGTGDPVRVNALMIGGIVPSRNGQSYGGLHNFPRLLEFWAKTPKRQLVIAGGFFQLNFSAQAVAPFDQDAWEPGAASFGGTTTQIGSTGNQHLSNFYYGSATRIWGYDVGFQYTPAGPIARRFVRIDRPRSEFYRELPVDDPYISQLCAFSGGSC